mmetsp:Transcript_50002/g.132145  ORF Transcript_50002/g.132145 Transcript_50002/m.132145 type:complete len:397 (+) Transcript_50002:92-1282(+)
MTAYTRASRRQCGSGSCGTFGAFGSSLGCSAFAAHRWPGPAWAARWRSRLPRESSSSGFSGGAERCKVVTGACEDESFSSAFTAAADPCAGAAPALTLMTLTFGAPLASCGVATGGFSVFAFFFLPLPLPAGFLSFVGRCCFSRTDLASSLSPSCSRRFVTWLTSSGAFSPSAGDLRAPPQASTRAFRPSRSRTPRLSSLRRSRRAPDSISCASSCRFCARSAQAPSRDRIQRGRPAMCSTVVTVCSSLGRPACPYIRIARPTDCTKALGVAGTSTRCTRRTAKKLTPSEQVVASATITRSRSPRRLPGALKAASSSIVATSKGVSLAAATAWRCARSAPMPELLATSTSAFSGLAATAMATAWSLGAQAAMFARIRALLPLLPSCRLPKCTQRLQ